MSNRPDWNKWVLEKNVAAKEESLNKSDSVVIEDLDKALDPKHYSVEHTGTTVGHNGIGYHHYDVKYKGKKVGLTEQTTDTGDVNDNIGAAHMPHLDHIIKLTRKATNTKSVKPKIV
jgi:hypothetical protein